MKTNMTFPENITIIGVGLIGGSIALGLKLHLASKIKILGLCNDSKRAKQAKERGVIDKVILNLSDIPKNTDLVIIATPVSDIIKILPLLARSVSKKSLIMDVGSTKEQIMNLAESFSNLVFVGTHPMAGTDLSGFENADPFLFHNKPWIICQSNNNDKDTVKIVEWLIGILGAKKVIMNAARHDQITAFSSHLMLVLSSVIVSANIKQTNWNLIAKAASSGFRDTTRLASHNPKVKTDIILSNKENIIKALSETKKEIDIFLKLIENSPDKLFNYLQKTKLIRDNWLSASFS